MHRVYDTPIGQITAHVIGVESPRVHLSGGDIPALIKSLGFTIDKYTRNTPRVMSIGTSFTGKKELSVFVSGITDRGLTEEQQKQIYDEVWAVLLPLFRSIIADKALLLTAEIERLEEFSYENQIAEQQGVIAAAEQEIKLIGEQRDANFRKWLNAKQQLHELEGENNESD